MTNIEALTLRYEAAQRLAFRYYLRTGHVPDLLTAYIKAKYRQLEEYKFNPYHREDNGQFDFATNHGATTRDQERLQRANQRARSPQISSPYGNGPLQNINEEYHKLSADLVRKINHFATTPNSSARIPLGQLTAHASRDAGHGVTLTGDIPLIGPWKAVGTLRRPTEGSLSIDNIKFTLPNSIKIDSIPTRIEIYVNTRGEPVYKINRDIGVSWFIGVGSIGKRVRINSERGAYTIRPK